MPKDLVPVNFLFEIDEDLFDAESFAAAGDTVMGKPIQVFPAGRHICGDGRPLAVDPEDVASMVAFAKANPNRFAVTYDHERDVKRGSEAAAWWKAADTDANDRGLFSGPVEWTRDAANEVKAKKWRYISGDAAGYWDDQGWFHPQRLLAASLVPKPAVLGMEEVTLSMAFRGKPVQKLADEELCNKMTADGKEKLAEEELATIGQLQAPVGAASIAHAKCPHCGKVLSSPVASGDLKGVQQMDKKQICAALGLSPDTSDEAVMSHLKAGSQGSGAVGQMGAASATEQMSDKPKAAAPTAAPAPAEPVTRETLRQVFGDMLKENNAEQFRLAKEDLAKQAKAAEAKRVLDEAIRQGRILPVEREKFSADVERDPEHFEKDILPNLAVRNATSDAFKASAAGDPRPELTELQKFAQGKEIVAANDSDTAALDAIRGARAARLTTAAQFARKRGLVPNGQTSDGIGPLSQAFGLLREAR